MPAEVWVRRCARRLSEAQRRGSNAGSGIALPEGLKGLPDLERHALVLQRLGGLSPSEVAAELDLTPAAASGLLERAAVAWRAGVRVPSAGLDDTGLFEGMRPLNLAPHPVAEVRRRGEGLRGRRRSLCLAAAVASVSLAVAGSVAGFSRAGWSLTDLGPGPGPGPDDRHELLFDPVRPRGSEIPEDFPLATGLQAPSADDLVGPGADVTVFDGMRACGRRYDLLGQLADRLALVLVGDSGRPTAQRELVVASELDLADADLAAQGILERFVAVFAGCPQEASGRRTTTTSVRRNNLGDEGWTILRTSSNGGTPAATEVLEVVRVGKALLVAESVGGASVATGDQDPVAADRGSVRDVVDLMCPWSDDGCP